MARLPTLLTALFLALIAAPAQAQTEETRSISVEGTTSSLVPNDTARFSAGVVARRKTANRALAAAGRTTRRVLARLAELGVARSDMRTTGVSVRRVFERDPDSRRLRVAGYRARTGVRVTVRELSDLGAVIDAVVEAGATDVGSVTFFAADTDAAYLEVLGAAFDIARAKAELLAEKAGLTLGAARFVSEGIEEDFFTTDFDRDSAESPAEGGAPPIRSGRTRVEATVSVVFDATAP